MMSFNNSEQVIQEWQHAWLTIKRKTLRQNFSSEAISITGKVIADTINDAVTIALQARNLNNIFILNFNKGL